MTIGEVIRHYCKQLGISRYELAKRSGITDRGLKKMMHGATENIPLSTIIALSEAFAIHPITLLRKLFPSWSQMYARDHSEDQSAAIGSP